MIKLFRLIVPLFIAAAANAQTTIYSQTFNTDTANEWTLNTSDLGGASAPNRWVINNTYPGNIIAPTATPEQPSGITGGPESYYMHIRSNVGPANCTFNASGTHSYFTAMNTPIVTTGYTGVNLSFWWVCNGDAVSVGEVYYRTNDTAAWTIINTTSIPPAALDSYNVNTTWLQATIHLDSFDNQPFLEIGYRFRHQGTTGSDPAFGVDDIFVTGTPVVVVTPPVASETSTGSTACQDSCITFTSTSTGVVDSVKWTSTGGIIATPTDSATAICFPAAGTYSVTLTAYNSGGSDSTSTVVTVNPTPMPVITQSGNTLSVTGTYTSYQWLNGATPITGATNANYTVTSAGSYAVVVDSGGCYGGALITATYIDGVQNVTGSTTNFWLTQQGNNAIQLNESFTNTESLEVAVYDATGRKMIADMWAANTTGRELNTGELPAGLYIIRISNRNTAAVLKWMKQ